MKRFLLIFLFLIILVNLASAQTARGFFNLGADLYIKGHLEQAIQVVHEGLQRFPNDPYLKALAEKLKQKKQQQKQQQQQQQNQQQQKKQEQQKRQQAQKEKEKQQKDRQKKEQQQKQKGKKKQMTKKEAERILRALKEENKNFKKKHIRVPAGRRQMDKNW